MATDGRARRQPANVAEEWIGGGAFAAGALLLGGEAAVHVQQYVTVVHGIRWIGPLFIAQAVACAVVIVGLLFARTRRLAALVGIVISAGALAALVVSYGRGLFGFFEAGFRAGIAVAVITELGAVVFLSVALAVTTTLVHVPDMHPWTTPAEQPRQPTADDSTRQPRERVGLGR